MINKRNRQTHRLYEVNLIADDELLFEQQGGRYEETNSVYEESLTEDGKR